MAILKPSRAFERVPKSRYKLSVKSLKMILKSFVDGDVHLKEEVLSV